MWTLALLIGEVAGIGIVLFRGEVLRFDAEDAVEDKRLIIKTVIALMSTDLISNFVYNGDRVVRILL